MIVLPLLTVVLVAVFFFIRQRKMKNDMFWLIHVSYFLLDGPDHDS